jgi:hypothetical protein
VKQHTGLLSSLKNTTLEILSFFNDIGAFDNEITGPCHLSSK